MKTIYFAGDLFDHKHITGNLLLAQAIEKLSDNYYTCILPQKWENKLQKTEDIRNKDVAAIIRSDLILLNFDGTDLDSGTVVEFVIAKMLDIPAVLLRTDFRNGAYLFGQDWNNMLTGFPRCSTIKHPALTMCQEMEIEKYHETVAQSIIDAFEDLTQQKSLFTSQEEITSAYQHVIKMCGKEFEKMFPLNDLHKIINAKLEKDMDTQQKNISSKLQQQTRI